MATPETPRQQPATSSDTPPAPQSAEQPTPEPAPQQPLIPSAAAAPPPPYVPPAAPFGAPPPMPPGMSATTSQPMSPVARPPFPPQQPWTPTAFGPPVRQGAPRPPHPGMPRVRPSRGPIPRRDIVAGAALVIAAGLTVGGMFPNLDHAVDRAVNSDNSLGRVDSIVNTSPWYFHADSPGPPASAIHLTQFFGVGLALGALLALALGVSLVLGAGRIIRQHATWGAVAAALLLGAIITTGTSAVNDAQFDDYVPVGGRVAPGSHVTTFGLGFWLLLGAAVVTVVAIVLLLLRDRRAEPPTPRFGFPAPMPQPPGYPQPPYPGR